MSALPAAPRPMPTIQPAATPAVLGDERNEQMLLGAVMLRGSVDPSNSLFKKILHFKEEYFLAKPHRIIFRAMMRIHSDGLNVEYDSVLDRLKKMENPKAPGHFAIQDVPENVLEAMCASQSGNVDLLIELITVAWVRRHDTAAAQEKIKWAADGNISTKQYLEMAEAQGRENMVLYSSVIGTHAQSMTEGIAEVASYLAKDHDNPESGTFSWHTGIQGITDLMGGLENGTVSAFGGRPGDGKSIMLQLVATSIMNQGGRPFIISLEMLPKKFWERMLVAEMGVEWDRLKSGNMTADERRRLPECLSRLQQHKMGDHFLIEFLRMPTLAEMRMKIAREKHGRGVDVFLLDYAKFSKITPSNDRLAPNIQQGLISQWMVSIAKEFNIPVVCAAQMSRDIEKRGGEPILSDLEWSGAMEQDLDFVGMLRDEDTKTGAGHIITNCHVVKSRNGATGVVPMIAKRHLFKFEEAHHGR